MTIEEGNKCIAEFMGYHLQAECYYQESHRKGIQRSRPLWFKHALYHQSWDWLMPVVEKISRIEFERRYDEGAEKWVLWTHHPVTFGMLDENGHPMVRFYCSTVHTGNTLIEAAWLAVVDFVTWHKTQQ